MDKQAILGLSPESANMLFLYRKNMIQDRIERCWYFTAQLLIYYIKKKNKEIKEITVFL